MVIARALILLAAQKPLRILCGREVQKSIKDSVHGLLNDQIQALGLGASFDVLEAEIRGKNGSLFLFAGLSQHGWSPLSPLKAWTFAGWRRRRSSQTFLRCAVADDPKGWIEVWLSLNPDMETDETYQRFVANPPPPNALVEQVNWRDNPWFPAVLEAERQETLRRDPDSYENIWEGKPKRVAEGAIYALEIDRRMHKTACVQFRMTRCCVHLVWDLGWNDSMTIGFFQRSGSEVRCMTTSKIRSARWIGTSQRWKSAPTE